MQLCKIMTDLEILQEMLDPGIRFDQEFNRILKREPTHPEARLVHVPKVVCADGFTMSVQASAYHYCSPRDSQGPYASAEVGFPSEKVGAFMPYIDDEDADPTETVYAFVPLEIIAQAITDHGGFAET